MKIGEEKINGEIENLKSETANQENARQRINKTKQ